MARPAKMSPPSAVPTGRAALHVIPAPAPSKGAPAPTFRASELGRLTLKELLTRYEAALLKAALYKARGNQRRAARALGILPTTLNEKLKRLGLRGEAVTEQDLGEADGTAS